LKPWGRFDRADIPWRDATPVTTIIVRIVASSPSSTLVPQMIRASGSIRS
jgi:hypothetical protein